MFPLRLFEHGRCGHCYCVVRHDLGVVVFVVVDIALIVTVLRAVDVEADEGFGV